MDYQQKYLKYKEKYLHLKQQIGKGYNNIDELLYQIIKYPKSNTSSTVKNYISNNEDKIKKNRGNITEFYNNSLINLFNNSYIKTLKIEFIELFLKKSTMFKYIIDFINIFNDKDPKKMKTRLEKRLNKNPQEKSLILNNDNVLLQIALFKNVDIEIIKLLISEPFNQENLSKPNKIGDLPIFVAFKSKSSMEVIKLLITEKIKDNRIMFKIIMLIDNKFNENPDNTDFTYEKEFCKLFMTDTNLNTPYEGEIPLCDAIRYVLPLEIIKLLATNDGKQNQNIYDKKQYSNNNTLLHLALYSLIQHIEDLKSGLKIRPYNLKIVTDIIKFLNPSETTKNLKNINENKPYDTPLDVAVQNGFFDFSLLTTKDNIDYVNNVGSTPLAIFIKKIYDNVSKIHFFPSLISLQDFIKSADFKIDELISETNKDIKDKNDNTPLHNALLVLDDTLNQDYNTFNPFLPNHDIKKKIYKLIIDKILLIIPKLISKNNINIENIKNQKPFDLANSKIMNGYVSTFLNKLKPTTK